MVRSTLKLGKGLNQVFQLPYYGTTPVRADLPMHDFTNAKARVNAQPVFSLDFIAKGLSARPAVAPYQFILGRVRV